VLWQDKIFHLNISLIEYAAAMKKKPGVPASSKWEAFDEGHRKVLGSGWREAISLGRVPPPDEDCASFDSNEEAHLNQKSEDQTYDEE